MLSIYDLSQKEEWDSIVKSFKSYDVYYLSGYLKAFQLHGDGEPLLFYYNEGALRGINIVMKRDIHTDINFSGIIEEGCYFDLATPYGYGGWLVEGIGDINKLLAEYEIWCFQNNIICEFVRFHPILKNHLILKDYYDVIHLGSTISMELDSPNVIWTNITSKGRNMIRKAMKNGLSVYRAQNPEIYSVFREIYEDTMLKDDADRYYYFEDEFYKSIMEDLKNHSQVFYVTAKNGEIVAASIMIYANGRLNYHLSGSKKEYQNLGLTNLLIYETALWGSENGFSTFHLGGGVGSKEDGLYLFKKSFNRNEPNPYFIGKKIFNHQIYEKLCAIRTGIESTTFFPAYRA